MKTRKIKLKVTRHEWWFPEYEVPAHMTDDEALEHVQTERPEEVYDEYHNQDTYDQDCWSELKTDPDPWADDPKHCVADWQHEVASGDTRLGYRDWIKNQSNTCDCEDAEEKSDYYVTGKYRTYHNQFGIGALNDFQLEVRADDIESAREVAVDKIMSDGRRHADSVRDIEIYPLSSMRNWLSKS